VHPHSMRPSLAGAILPFDSNRLEECTFSQSTSVVAWKHETLNLQNIMDEVEFHVPSILSLSFFIW